MKRTESTGDALTVLPKPTKQICLGVIWDGNGGPPRMDFATEARADVVVNLSTGEVVAEFFVESQQPPPQLDPGAVWTGIAEQLAQAAEKARERAEAAHRVTPARTSAICDSRRDFLTVSNAATANSIASIREQSQRLWGGPASNGLTRDAIGRPGSTQRKIEEINAANRKFWSNGPDAA